MGKFAPIAIRYLIIACVQMGLVSLAEKYVIPYLNKAIEEIMVLFGVEREQAQDILANEIIRYAESIGIFAAVLKTKMPVKVAEMLGFTSKGFNLRKITNTVAGSKAGSVKTAKLSNTNAVVLATADATAVVAQAVKSTVGFKVAYDMVLKTLGVGFMGFMVVGNWLDFGNWNSGAYQKSMQKFLEWISFGKLVPDEDYRKSKTASADVFTKVYETFKIGGAVGIQDPYKGVEVPFTRDNMLDLVDEVGASLLLTTGAASTKNLLKAMLPMIIFIAGNENKIDGMVYSSSSSSVKSSGAVATTPKVFMGIVSQGVVGAGLVFTPRPDDLIESASELREAAANNLAPFLTTLPGKIVYEVKVVSSILTKEGFKQTGKTQQIQTGTWANGTPKYKTVTNKFATLVVYALTDKGSRAKLTTIVLGPTDATKLTVAQNDLRALETALPALVTTTDIKDIKSIESPEPVQVTQTETQKYETVPEGVWTPERDQYWKNLGYLIAPCSPGSSKMCGFAPIGKATPQQETNEKAPDDPGNKFNTSTGKPNPKYKPEAPAPLPVTAPVVSPGTSKPTGAGVNATTLYEWYQAKGQAMPSVSTRSQLYASLGLGQASYYTGTAEQNTKLLAALKSGANSTAFVPPTFNPSIEGNALRAS